jgi:hypothetical protein
MLSRSRKFSSFRRRSDDGSESRGFDRSRLPEPRSYYENIFGPLRFNNNGWAVVRCCFHLPDRHPSLSIHRDGGFTCHACHMKGGSVIDFEMLRSQTDFKTAARDLGAWR